MKSHIHLSIFKDIVALSTVNIIHISLERGDAWRKEKERERSSWRKEKEREDEMAQQQIPNCVKEVHV